MNSAIVTVESRTLPQAVVLVFLMASSTLWSAERVLHFPESAPVGVVVCSPLPIYDGPFIVFSNTKLSVQRAQGVVVVPDDCFIELELTGRTSSDLAFLSKLAGSLNSLIMNAAKISREQVLLISGLHALTKLAFDDCEFSEDAFTAIPAMPKLVSLTCSSYSNPPKAKPKLELWVKDLHGLEQMYVKPTFNSDELQCLRGHPRLTWANVDVTADLPKCISAFEQMPSLRGLNVWMPEDADTDWLEGIGLLTQLERIRWIGGKVDTATLLELADLPRLIKLDLLHIEADSTFCDGIEAMKGLEELQIYPTGKFKLQYPRLLQILLKMPKLKRWPDLSEVDLPTLQSICKLEQIERLKISSPIGINRQDFDELGQLKNLKELELHHVDVDDFFLKSIAGLTKLEYLHFWATRVTGAGFESLGNLRSLRKLHICNERSELDLSSIARLPVLEEFHLCGQNTPKVLLPLRNCTTLKRLRFWFGTEVDDTTAAWIGSCPGIVELNMEGNLTDQAAGSLTALPSLQSLFIASSNITKERIFELASIPSMHRLIIDTTPGIGIEINDALREQFPWIPFVLIRNNQVNGVN